MLWNGDSEKYCTAVLILIRHYYNCVSEVLAVVRFCMRVIVLWLAKFCGHASIICESLCRLLSLGRAQTMTSFLFAVESVRYPINDCHRRKLFIGRCIGFVALKRQQIIFCSTKLTFFQWHGMVACAFWHYFAFLHSVYCYTIVTM
jgi:hypothetical protein